MTVVKVVEDIAFGAHWPCQSIGRGLCAKVQTGGSPRASREPLVASADEPSVGPEKDRHFSQGGLALQYHIVGSHQFQIACMCEHTVYTTIPYGAWAHLCGHRGICAGVWVSPAKLEAR